MGVQSRLVGYVEEAWPGVAAGGDATLMQHRPRAGAGAVGSDPRGESAHGPGDRGRDRPGHEPV